MNAFKIAGSLVTDPQSVIVGVGKECTKIRLFVEAEGNSPPFEIEFSVWGYSRKACEHFKTGDLIVVTGSLSAKDVESKTGGSSRNFINHFVNGVAKVDVKKAAQNAPQPPPVSANPFDDIPF